MRLTVRVVMGALLAAILATPANAQQPSQATPPPATEPVRDAVGDLNAETIKAGGFPGSFLIPGPGNVSFGIGGFIKTLLFRDSGAEGRESVFLPALLGGLGRDDKDGGTSMSAELTRMNFDARAPLDNGRVRGYVEFDFSGDLFKWRHGYLTWSGPWGEVLAGKTWSTFMDLQTLPDGLGEPTVSGAIFARQAQFRYTRTLNTRTKVSISVEDPTTSDILSAEPLPTRTAFPDAIGTISIGTAAAHVQVGGLVRSIEIDPNDRDGVSDVGGGVHISGHVNLTGRDRMFGALVMGKGLGRYLLGVTPSAGAFFDEQLNEVRARGNTGGFFGVRHVWSASCRSSLVGSYATAETSDRQPPSAFANSSFTLANVLCKANRFVTVGAEWDYGTRENRGGETLDSHRFMFGMQLF